jgi:hypothetical protein
MNGTSATASRGTASHFNSVHMVFSSPPKTRVPQEEATRSAADETTSTESPAFKAKVALGALGRGLSHFAGALAPHLWKIKMVPFAERLEIVHREGNSLGASVLTQGSAGTQLGIPEGFYASNTGSTTGGTRRYVPE